MLILSTATFGACNPIPTDQTKETRSCPQYEVLLQQHNPGWDINRMSRIMWRESRCRPDVRSSTADTGLLQINDINHRYLTGKGVDVNQLTNPTVNIQAAATLYRYWTRALGDGYHPWKTS